MIKSQEQSIKEPSPELVKSCMYGSQNICICSKGNIP